MHEKLEQQAATATVAAEDPKKALIAAAIARAEQQKAQVSPANTDNLTPEQRAEIAAIDARRAQLREMAKTAPALDE